jgi:hypothetical protein
MATTTNDEIDFDFSQLDDTLISDNQKQNLVDYINQLKTQKRSINDELSSFKLSTGSISKKFYFSAQIKIFCKTYYFLFLTKRTNEYSCYFIFFLLLVIFLYLI